MNKFARLGRSSLLTVAFFFLTPLTVFADLNQLYLYTVEWLVDNSDTIIVARPNDQRSASVAHVLKGGDISQGDTVQWAGVREPRRGYSSWEPEQGGSLQLLFLQNARLLQAVRIDREAIVTYAELPSLARAFYGVDQYGKMILSDAALQRRVRERIRQGPGELLPNHGEHGAWSGIEAPHDFPLETNGETYVLVVPMTVERRNHFVRKLETGDASERLRASYELYCFRDEESRTALREATAVRSVANSFSDNVLLTAESVRSRATALLSRIEKTDRLHAASSNSN